MTSCVTSSWRHTYRTCRRISSRCLASRCTPPVSSRTCWRSLGRRCRTPACCRHCRRSCHTFEDTDTAPSGRPATAHTGRRSYSACRGTDWPCPAGIRSTPRHRGGRPPSMRRQNWQERRWQIEVDAWSTFRLADATDDKLLKHWQTECRDATRLHAARLATPPIPPQRALCAANSF